MKYISLFSGIGGFDLGFDRAGMECVLQVEKDEKARAVLARHWPNVPRMELVEDVTRDSLRELGIETVDLVCGGFPCQDLSVAGRRAGLAGERSGLWFEFLRVIEEVKPKWVVIENVPGLLSSNSGRDMGTLLNGLGQRGYWWAYRVLDAQYFGVPQRRRRVFIVASTRKFAPQEILFERDSSPRDTPPSREAGPGVAQTAIRRAQTSSNGWGIKEDGSTVPVDPSGGDAVFVAHSVRPRSGIPQGWNSNLVAWDNGQGDPNGDDTGLAYALNGQANQGVAFGGNNTSGEIDVACALNAHGSKRYDFESETFITNAFNGYTGGADDNDAQGNHLVIGFDSSRSQYTGNIAAPLRVNGAVKPGVNDGKPDNMCISGPMGVRRLTPVECNRLQGFPDDWNEWGLDKKGQRVELSDSARYRQAGNAVAVPCSRWVGRRIVEAEAVR